MNPVRIAAGTLAAMVLVGTTVGCSSDEQGFQRKAAQMAGDQLRRDQNLDSEVTCEAPADTDVGTTFRCSAKASDGIRYEFEAEITGARTVEVRAIP